MNVMPQHVQIVLPVRPRKLVEDAEQVEELRFAFISITNRK
jgi:hypothetical protein